MSERFKALILDQVDGETKASFKEIGTDELPKGDVLLKVHCSTLNYKDGLAITGAGKIVRDFPFVPGVDLAGTVVRSESPSFREGDAVVLTGYGVGERHWGGLAEMARVKSEWLMPLPKGMSLEQAMAVGTAGFTSMLCVQALEEQGLTPDQGEIAVTGAAGGVGSVALPLLAKRGFRAVASTGRMSLEGYLKSLGASRVIDRGELSTESKAPLGSAQWAGAIDTVGGTTLAGLLKTTKYHGVVAACGLAGGPGLPTTVFPFILRGVRLIGVDSVYTPMEQRRAAWDRLAEDLDFDLLANLTTHIDLDEVIEQAPKFLDGTVKGRIVVRM